MEEQNGCGGKMETYDTRRKSMDGWVGKYRGWGGMENGWIFMAFMDILERYILGRAALPTAFFLRWILYERFGGFNVPSYQGHSNFVDSNKTGGTNSSYGTINSTDRKSVV